jgi:hypothetical protein
VTGPGQADARMRPLPPMPCPLAAQGLCRSRSQPLVDGGEVDGGLVADGEFVEAGGRGAVAFDAVDAAFDDVTLLVDAGVEGRWSAALGYFGPPVGVHQSAE